MRISFHLHLVKWLIRHSRYTKVLSCGKGVDPPRFVLDIDRSRLMIVPLRIVVYQLPCATVLAVKPVNTEVSPLRIRYQHPVVRKWIGTPVQTTLLLPLDCTLENSMFPSGVSAGSKLERTL